MLCIEHMFFKRILFELHLFPYILPDCEAKVLLESSGLIADVNLLVYPFSMNIDNKIFLFIILSVCVTLVNSL